MTPRETTILGTSAEIYKEYSKAIRKEYSWVSESAYCKGRQKALQSFIEREKIYFTDDMKIRYEDQARNNIHSEIKLLNTQKKTYA